MIYTHMWIYGLALFMLAIVSDVLDGIVARAFAEESTFGAYLDPCADKLLILSCYASLYVTTVHGFHIPFWFLMLILAKEIALGAGAIYYSAIQQKIAIHPLLFGKLAMFIQSICIGLILLHGVVEVPLYVLHLSMWGVVLCVCAAFIQYSVTLLQRLFVWV
jgi:cardiolipin synthase